MVDLTNVDALKHLLEGKGIKPQRSAGQNFLVCREPVEAAVEILKDGPENVTELGAGMGVLTLPLLEAGFHVKAIERDAALAGVLQKLAPKAMQPRLELINGDLKETPWAWDAPYQIAGNIPYNLSGLILRRITQLDPVPAAAVLMVQREVAQRLTATPPDMNLLAVAVALWGEASDVMSVPRSCFWPEPEVHSSLVLLKPHDAAQSLEVREAVLKIAKVFFQAKRKQMGGTLRRMQGVSAEEAEETLRKAGVEPSMRPQEVSLEQWKKLSAIL